MRQSKFRIVYAIKFFLPLMLIIPLSNVSAQSILKKIKSKVEQSATEKILDQTDKKVSKSIDNAINAARGEQKSTEEETIKQDKIGTTEKLSMMKAYSKYDFIPGDSIIYANDFSSESLGELPTGWNTNGNSVIMKLEGLNGQWLRIAQKTVNLTDNKKTFGTDFTVEFDAFLQFDFKGWLPPSILFGLLASGTLDPAGNHLLSDPKGDKTFYIEVSPLSNGANTLLESYKKYARYFNSPTILLPSAKNWYGRVVHVAMQIQKERLRIWINGEKMYDIPKAIPLEGTYNQLFFQLSSSPYSDEQIGVYFSNIKIAKGLADARHKLVTEGHFSTTGILFDLGSSVIKSESLGVLKLLGDVLVQNPDIKIKIIGHTDALGDEKTNQLLSEQRAIAIKNSFRSEFGIADNRLEAIGKGETEPVGDNKTKEGMAQNRRVEFIRL